MVCRGHQGLGSCYLPEKPNSFWRLCQSCESIQNRLFLEAVQKALKEDKTTFSFHGESYSLEDPDFPRKYLRHSAFNPSHNDPRLSLLKLCLPKNKVFFENAARQFATNSGFLLSANLLYRKHLPQKLTCLLLTQIQRITQQYFLDLPTCPCCMAKSLPKLHKPLLEREVLHINGIFRNRILAQHPTWFVYVFRLLQSIWEQDLEEVFTIQLLNSYSIFENSIHQGIEFGDWLGAFLETPIVMEKLLTGRISEANRLSLERLTGHQMSINFLRRVLRSRNEVYKEELIMRTWHPRRLFAWCLDMEELIDFGVWPLTSDPYQSMLSETDH